MELPSQERRVAESMNLSVMIVVVVHHRGIPRVMVGTMEKEQLVFQSVVMNQHPYHHPAAEILRVVARTAMLLAICPASQMGAEHNYYCLEQN